MFEFSKSKQNQWAADRIISEVKQHRNIKGDEPSAQEVLEYLLGDRDGWTDSEFVVYRYDDIKERSFIQRLNLIWFMPLFIVTIPIQYLVTGTYGVRRNTWLGHIVEKLVKFD